MTIGIRTIRMAIILGSRIAMVNDNFSAHQIHNVKKIKPTEGSLSNAPSDARLF